MTAKTTLQRSFENQVLTPQDIHTFCIEDFGEKITFFYTFSEEIEEKKFFGNQIRKCSINSWNPKIA